MKREFVEIIIETSDIIGNVDCYFHYAFKWVNFCYSEIDESYINFLKELIPATKQKFLKNVDIKAQFEYDCVRTVEQAYINSMESNLVDKIDYYIKDTISDNLPLDYVSITGFYSDDREAKSLTWSDYIIVKFKRLDYVKFQRSRDYWDRINNTFEEEIIEVILENKRNFDYDNLYESYNWYNNDKLKELWNDYNETIPAINELITKKKEKLKSLIKNHVSIFKREQILESIC